MCIPLASKITTRVGLEDLAHWHSFELLVPLRSFKRMHACLFLILHFHAAASSSFSLSIYNNTAWAGPTLNHEEPALAVIPPLGAFQSAELIGTVHFQMRHAMRKVAAQLACSMIP
jgi:hypothetical protein